MNVTWPRLNDKAKSEGFIVEPNARRPMYRLKSNKNWAVWRGVQSNWIVAQQENTHWFNHTNWNSFERALQECKDRAQNN